MERPSVNRKILPIVLGISLVIPTIAGSYRAGVLLVEWDWLPVLSPTHVDNLPLFFHVVFAILFLVLGAVQILSGGAGHRSEWHRKSGRITAVAGLFAAGTGLLMTVNHPEIATPLLLYARVFFGALWAVFIVLAVRAILRRDNARHRAHMIRAYAIALNAGTLPFVYLPIYLIWGDLTPPLEDGVQIIGWVLNLAVAEFIIRRPGLPARRPTINTGKQHA